MSWRSRSRASACSETPSSTNSGTHRRQRRPRCSKTLILPARAVSKPPANQGGNAMGLALSRRGVLLGGLAAAATPFGRDAAAAAWPERSILLAHGFGAGGNADVTARIVAEPLAVRLGQPVVVEPKP